MSSAPLEDQDYVDPGEPEPRKFFAEARWHEDDGNAPDHATFRLRLEWEEGECTELVEEKLTSDSDRAQAVVHTRHGVTLSLGEVRWLHARLGELIAEQDKV